MSAAPHGSWIGALAAVTALAGPGPLGGPAGCAAQTPSGGHTISAAEGAPRPDATLEDVAWMAGRWVGEGLGATAEEVWLPPAGGAMPGVFRLLRDGEVLFYELVTLVEDEGSLLMRLKHFEPDLVGWEEKDGSVSFRLLRRDQDTLWFDGLTIRHVDPDRMRIWVELQSEGEEPREVLFEYRRVG